MKYVYCTLFDKNYLIKGLVTVYSLIKCAKEYKIYVLALDDETEVILKSLNIDFLVVISLNDFLDEDYQQRKCEQSNTAFCWSCSANLLQYIFNVFQEMYCTYIDADLFFYEDPSCLIDEMIYANKSVQIMEHRFSLDEFGKRSLKYSGRFCVEFNTFKNTPEAMLVLNEWVGKVNKCCEETANGLVFGDQKYLDDWTKQYDCVHICENVFAGVAPWNIGQYRLEKNNLLLHRTTMKKGKLIFYHFHGIEMLPNGNVDIYAFRKHWIIDEELMKRLYKDYFKEILLMKKEMDEKFDKDFSLFKHRSILPRTLSDEIKLRFSQTYVKELRWNIEMRIKSVCMKDKDIFDLGRL